MGSLVRIGDLGKAIREVTGLHPADQAQMLRTAPEAVSDVIVAELTPAQLAAVVDQGETHDVGNVIRHLSPQQLAQALDLARPERAAAGLRLLDLATTQEVLGLMVDSADVRASLGYPATAVGSMMAPRFPRVLATATVRQALAQLYAEQREPPYRYNSAYVVDGGGKLAGYAHLLNLAVADADATVDAVAQPIFATLTTDTERTAAISMMGRYNLSQIAVVDADGMFLGAIPQDYVATIAIEEGTSELQRMGAVEGDRLTGPLKVSVRTRLPWLFINLGTTFLAAGTVSLFADTIASVVLLAAFLPVVAGQGGIGGTQTMTLMVRAIALGEIAGLSPFRLLRRELLLGAMHGLALGAGVGAVVFVWEKNLGLALVLGLAMWGNMIIAGMVGSAVPLVLLRLRQDPAVSSAIVITTFTDVLGFSLFLGLATLMLGWLM